MAAAFSANRDIKIEASETSAGVYALRTRGLEGKRRPELEIAGVPEAALNAAAGVINLIADYTVNNAEVFADQTVGNVLTVGEEGRKLLVAVRTTLAEKPKGGLWSKISGGGKGVLRLVDVTGDAGTPLTALATMLVHRAAVRRAKDDDEGARTELEAALATFPGEAGAGEPPSIGGADGTFNWQNHLAYLDLAAIADDDVDAAAEHFGDALARSPELARRELGASFAAATSLEEDDVAAAAKRIIEHNLGDVHRGPSPAPSLITIASPIWELDGDRSARRASLLPAALIALYYEGAAAERLRSDGAALVTRLLARERAAPWRAAWIARGARTLWRSEEAPMVDSVPAHPANGIVSLVLADVARCFRAGATNDEILARYGERGAEKTAALEALESKLGELGAWEGEQYIEAMSL
jgi:hypothetical protein